MKIEQYYSAMQQSTPDTVKNEDAHNTVLCKHDYFVAST